MSDLVAWLTRILDEDEAMAQAAVDDDGGQDGGFEDEFDRLTKGRKLAGPLAFEPSFAEACARMITWNTPRRVLADIAAKRAIIARYNEVRTRPAGPDAYVNGIGMARVESFEMVVETLASAYADRPGYRADWREAWER